MKIIFLNCWYAKEHNNFYEFIQKEKNSTDIFCFVEVNPNNFREFSKVLNKFNGYYATYDLFTNSNCIYGQAIFVKKNIKVKEDDKFRVYKNSKSDVGFIQTMGLRINNSNLNIVNVHGKTHPWHKLDTPTRIKQSQSIFDFLKNKKGLTIIGGDFNLLPNTKSVKLFEQNGYVDLIKKFGITDTRGKINHEIYKNKIIQYYADYCFVSPDVKVKSFTVPDIEISDHLPLILEFEV